MRGNFLTAVGAAWALPAGVTKAGLYDPAQLAQEAQQLPNQGKPLPFSSFRDQLNELFTIGIPQPVNPARARHLERAKELAARVGSGQPRVEDLIGLGAEYVRLGRTGEAV